MTKGPGAGLSLGQTGGRGGCSKAREGPCRREALRQGVVAGSLVCEGVQMPCPRRLEGQLGGRSATGAQRPSLARQGGEEGPRWTCPLPPPHRLWWRLVGQAGAGRGLLEPTPCLAFVQLGTLHGSRVPQFPEPCRGGRTGTATRLFGGWGCAVSHAQSWHVALPREDGRARFSRLRSHSAVVGSREGAEAEREERVARPVLTGL